MDLVVLVADKQMEQAVQGILGRPNAVPMRQISSTMLVHPGRDPAVLASGHELVGPYARDHDHALLLLDMAWKGCPSKDPARIERTIEEGCANAWDDRARCVAIDPELEAWVWSPSPHVARVLGWSSREELDGWLAGEGLVMAGQSKPDDPKRAFERALRFKRLPPSAAQFRRLAECVSFRSGADAAFNRLLSTLRQWFPAC